MNKLKLKFDAFCWKAGELCMVNLFGEIIASDGYRMLTPSQYERCKDWFTELDPTLGSKAREIRTKFKFTGLEVAQKIGTSASYVYSLEKGDDDYFNHNASRGYLNFLESLSGERL